MNVDLVYSYVRKHKLAFSAVTGVIVLSVLLVILIRNRDDPARETVPADALTRSDDMAGMNMMTADGSVQLTPGQVSEFGITFATVEMRPLSGEVRAVGSIAVDETRIAAVTMKFSGFIERLYIDFTGRPVNRGQPLFEIYSPDVLAAQEELLLAARLQSSSTRDIPGVPSAVDLVAAAQQRLRLWDISEAQIDGILRAGAAKRTVTIYAPASGVVLEKNVVAGQAIEAGQLLYRIADLTRVWIEAEVREADAGLISTGARATAESTALPGRTIAGNVEYVYPTVQADARSLRTRISVPNAGGALRPGMYVAVRIDVGGRTALAVPNSAVVNTGTRTIVFVDYGAGRIRPQDVIAGRAGDQFTEIISGLEPGQRVVTSAQFLLDSESNLAEVMRGMISQGAGGMQMPDTGSMKDMPGMQMPSGRR
ncbi:MAG: efflux RND transporter periplasmic adaptor subunit [Gemmatimonadota bacterium]